MPISTEIPKVTPKRAIEQWESRPGGIDLPLCRRSSGPFLWPGLEFKGEQRDVNRHEVDVLVQDVDFDRGFLCGYITTLGLAEDLAVLSTYFEGEIVSPFYSFRTQHPEWGASWEDDLDRWRKFKPFRDLPEADREDFVLQNYKDQEYLFMRWKELFPVPDHQLAVKGASYQGFYYVCFNQRTGAAVGYYFQKEQPAKFQDQLLKLYPVNTGLKPSFEFR